MTNLFNLKLITVSAALMLLGSSAFSQSVGLSKSLQSQPEWQTQVLNQEIAVLSKKISKESNFLNIFSASIGSSKSLKNDNESSNSTLSFALDAKELLNSTTNRSMSDLDYLSTLSTIDAAKQALIQDFVSAYLSYDLSSKKLELYKQQLAVAQDVEEIYSKLKDMNEVSYSDYNTKAQAVLSLKDSILSESKNLNNQKDYLTRKGLNIEDLTDTYEWLKSKTNIVTEKDINIMSKVLSARLAVEKQVMQSKLDDTNFWPSVSLSASLAKTGLNFIGSPVTAVLSSINWNFLNYKSNKLTSEKDNLTLKKLSLAYTTTTKDTLYAIDKARVGVDTSTQSLNIASGFLTKTEKTTDVTRKKFEVGLLSKVNLLDQEKALYDAKLNLTTATYNQAVAQLSWLYSMEVLVSDEQSKTNASLD